jgi:hypothetical protein
METVRGRTDAYVLASPAQPMVIIEADVVVLRVAEPTNKEGD